MAKRATTIVKCDEVPDYDRQAQISEIIDENINGSEDIEVLTDARFRQNFDLMRYSGEMCDVEIVVEESKFKGSFFWNDIIMCFKSKLKIQIRNPDSKTI